MLISCKITYSLLTALDQQGVDTAPLLESLDVPEEFLRDASCWLEAEKMELFLTGVQNNCYQIPDNFIRETGRQCESLKSWGVLDKVLRMMETPLDIFHQPHRFLSYFISPEPPILELRHIEDCICFQLPIHDSQYPRIVEYLSGALEGLPAFMNKAPAQVKWEDSLVTLRWSQVQEDLLQGDDLHLRQFNPTWVRSVMESLEEQQKTPTSNLSQSDRLLQSPTFQEMASLTRQLSPMSQNVHAIKDEFLKLHDYFARAQQLITLLVHSGRKTKQVEEAMRRMDWSHVQSSYNKMIDETCDRIIDTKEQLDKMSKQMELSLSTPPESPQRQLEIGSPPN